MLNWARRFIKPERLSNLRHQSTQPILKSVGVASLVGASTTMGAMLYHGVDPLDSMVRFNRTLYAGIKATMVYKRAEYVFGKDNPKFDALMEEAHGEIADILLELFLKQGGLYIKSGQYMASQDQSLPRAYKKLSVLQDSVEFKDFNIVEKTFEEEFGVSPFEMYKSVETIPIAAASIGQVHRAVTKDGNQVVIKVQYPEIRKRFSVDMFTYKVTLYLLEFIFKNAKLRWIGDEIEGFLHKELDFYNEAKNAERASNNFQGNLDYYIPKIYWDLTSKRILTLEYINGIKANDLEGIARLGLNRFDVANKVINCLAEQIFVHGFFHGDPHPGNVFVRRHPVKPGECQVVLLDHGLYKDMTPEARIRCCKLYRDIIIKDYKSFEATSKSIGIEDWKKLAFIILMRPLDNSMFEKHFPGMSVKDIHKFMTENRTLFAAKMEKIMLEEMDGWNKLMSNLPKEFLILIRNCNLSRAINGDLGAPVNRFVIYVRQSIRGLAGDSDESFFKRIWARIRFEAMVKRFEFFSFLEKIALYVMILSGQVSPTVNVETIGKEIHFENLPLEKS